MQQEKLTLENLRKLDFGIIAEAFKDDLKRVVKDCHDRPGLDKAREVAVVFRFAPKVDKKAGTYDDSTILVEAAVFSKVPKRVTKVYTMSPRHDGTLLFRPDEPDDPNADHLYDDDVRDRERRNRRKDEPGGGDDDGGGSPSK